MSSKRGEFSSKFGFIMAAAGSAVGLGNIWGFPGQAASNGGGAFLLVYLVLTFVLAYPVLMAELIIGRHTKSNVVTGLKKISSGKKSRFLGIATGLSGVLASSMILSFYAIVAGWMMVNFAAPLFQLLGMNSIVTWLETGGILKDMVFMVMFMLLTVSIIVGGVQGGIERWSSRLMPSLIVILVALTIYVMTLDGAMQGLRVYLIPNFSKVADPDLIVSAMGQAFFSISLGVGTMLIYGSYISSKENIVSLGGLVTVVDIGAAFLAGLLIIPAMYVAQENGIQIFDQAGKLIAEDRLIFAVLPALFDSMGTVGLVVAMAFFLLMSCAALTSSISMLEVPANFTIERFSMTRKRATSVTALIITLAATAIIFNFDALFILVVTISTQYAQPLLGFMFCLYVGWIWHRNQILDEIKLGYPEAESSLFWKIWPFYVRFICPLAIIVIFIRNAL